jgi:mRNA-degrading endonuclease RelE of RelBE toxin-antitoxin system
VSYGLRIADQARAYLRRLDRDLRRRMGQRIDQIQADPYGPHTKPLAGPGRLRAARVGDYRLVFAVDEAKREVHITEVGPRGDIYRRI